MGLVGVVVRDVAFVGFGGSTGSAVVVFGRRVLGYLLSMCISVNRC